MHSQSDTAQGMGGELLSDAKSVGTSAANRLHKEVDARKGNAVTQAQAVSSAVEKTIESLDDSAPAWLKKTLEQGAQQIQKFADAVDQKDSRQLVNDASDFARNSPGTFMAACAAAGFAAARIFKAGSSQNQPSQLDSVDPVDQTFDTASSGLPGSTNLSAVRPQGEYA